ncbi:hypothetical protein SK128_012896 [Halocaridina rubra]|uniref:DUF1279 domain-containing protein n=1 Tax=Halocaridina rubra TaxID=373956 RepID=A0AAN8WT56_HALRR
MSGLIKALGVSLGTASDGVTATDAAHMAEADVSSPSTTEGAEVSDSSKENIDATTRTAAGAATFVVAYAVHKVFAPARIGITLTATPFIVRYLRRIGFLKPPKSKAF